MADRYVAGSSVTVDFGDGYSPDTRFARDLADAGLFTHPYFISPSAKPYISATADSALTNGVAYYGRFVVPKAVKVSQLGFIISTGDASTANVAMGIYSTAVAAGAVTQLATTGLTSTDLTNAGTVIAALTSTVSLQAGVYWTGIMSPDWKSAKIATIGNAVIGTGEASLSDAVLGPLTAPWGQYAKAGSSLTDLPATASSGAGESGNVPLVYVIHSNIDHVS